MINNDDIQLSRMSYTDKDFGSLYPDLLDLAKQLGNKWDPSISNESDPGVVLLKEAAFVSDHNNYNIDKNILEVFLPSATQEESVQNIVEMNGYVPRYYMSATGDVTFSFKHESSENDGFVFRNFTIPAFTLVVSNEEGNITYTQVSNLSIQAEKVQASCVFMQGTLKDLTVNDSKIILLENLDDKKRIYFPNRFVAENGVFVRNSKADISDLWKRTDYLQTQPKKTKVYKIGFDSTQGVPYIEFPSDITDIIESGLEISYLYTDGSNGNVSVDTLTKIVSPDELKLEGITINTKDFTLANKSAITNGSDPETIAEIYESFKNVVGTFDTLVTCRDYSNAINTMRDSVYNNRLASNAVVTDINSDYNHAFPVITFDQYGKHFKVLSTCDGGMTKYEFVTSIPDEPKKGQIYFDPSAGAYEIYTGTAWAPITTLDYSSFKKDIDAMNQYDLYAYILKPFSMSEYSDYTPNYALNKSFTPMVADTDTEMGSREVIKGKLEEYKCISHTFRDFKDGDVCLIKNYVPLYITISPYQKVSKEEKASIISNVYKVLSEKFNATNVDFGEELNYDEVYNALLYADERIKNIRLEDFDYQPTIVIKDSKQDQGIKEIPLYGEETSEEAPEGDKYLLDMIAKNVLAGRVCLFNFEEDFDYRFGEISSNEYPKVEKITTESIITLPTEVTNTVTKQTQNSNIFTSTDVEMQLKASDGAAPEVTILAGATVALSDIVGAAAIEVRSSSTSLGFYSDTDTKKVSIKNNSAEDITLTSSEWVSANDIEIITTILEESVVYTESPSHTLTKNEFIQIAYPNYYSDKIYPTYVYYYFERPTQNSESVDIVPANTDYTLKPKEYIHFNYTDSETQTATTDTYGPGNVIRANFDLKATEQTNKKRKWVGPNGEAKEATFEPLAAGQQIEHRELLVTILNSPNTPCYWLTNTANNELMFTEDPQDKDFDYKILDNGEYFIYSNATFDGMVILGPGTKLSKSKNDTSEWKLTNDINVNIEAIQATGYNSGINWEYKDFSVNNFKITEMNIVSLGEGDTFTLALDKSINTELMPISENGSYSLNNNWQYFGCSIKYTMSGQDVTLSAENTGGYLVKSRLDLAIDGSGQELNNANNSQQSVTVYTSDKPEGETIKPTPETPESSDYIPVYIKSPISINLIGGQNINLKNTDTTINIQSFESSPVKYCTDEIDSEGNLIERNTECTSIQPNSEGTYVVDFNKLGRIIAPLHYKQGYEYLIPVFLGNPTSGTEVNITVSAVTRDESPVSAGKIVEFGSTIESEDTSLEISASGSYILKFIPTEAISEGEDINIKFEANSSIPNRPVTLYKPKIHTGINEKLGTKFELDKVVGRIKELIANSTDPEIKPYYINEPENILAIQDPDFSNPNILWDKNNVANNISIPQIVLKVPDEDNIDITKSMRNYK